MAITATTYELLKSLPIKRGSSLFEIGEANWYGDLDPQEVGLERKPNLFDIAKDFYAQWFAPSVNVAIDMNGTASAIKQDLNKPLRLESHGIQIDTRIGNVNYATFYGHFDVVINHGTAEHIFNIAQVFKSMHDACEVNGWLIHECPFLGWIDHGFYCLQPTLFYDIAAVNCYELSLVAIHEIKSRVIIRLECRDDIARLAQGGKIPMNSMLFVAMRKRVDKPFVLPMQGVYAKTLSEAGEQSWRELR